MKRFLVTTTSGYATIKADEVVFEHGHVAFWKYESHCIDMGRGQAPLEKITKHLVRAIHNPAVEAIEEIRDEQD